jgi:uncharacterized SAM-binding protein YcdF (DUF218 family)
MLEVIVDVQRAARYIFLPDEALEADVAVVLGMSDWRRPATRAVELYQEQKARTLLFTGGYNSRIEAREAVEMAAFARASGVPERDILIEPKAKHTDQNMELSKDLLKGRIELGEVRSLLLVTIHYHVRRAILAARKHFPSALEIGWVSYASKFYSSSDWQRTPEGRRDVASEIDKIEKYYGRTLRDDEDKSP